jgi:hypothetical protein
MLRRTLLRSAAATLAGTPIAKSGTAYVQQTPGVSATAIKIGNTMPYSGPASSFGVLGRAEGVAEAGPGPRFARCCTSPCFPFPSIKH